MCVYVCVCVCVCGWVGACVWFDSCLLYGGMCVCVCYVRLCACLCVVCLLASWRYVYLQVEYSLAAQDRRFFSVRASDGVLSATAPLDRETQDAYVLHVTARDKGTPSLSTVQEVKVTVGDANDHAPVFEPDTYAMTVR